MNKNWLAVVCAEHVQRGRAGGFMQVCHGKRTPLLQMSVGDYIVYYSPSTQMGGKDRLQAFTALGVICDGAPYQVAMSADFHPFRRDVDWLPAQSAPIAPLLSQLEWVRQSPNWGYRLRAGYLAISAQDMALIAAAMRVALPHAGEQVASFQQGLLDF